MKIILANKKGINNLVDETLAELPLNKRYDRIKGQYDEGYGRYKNETLQYKVRVLPAIGSYSQTLLMPDKRKVSRNIDLIGPYEDVPDFLIASNSKERKEIINRPIDKYGLDSGKISHYYQMQLTVLEDGIFIRYLGHQDKLVAATIYAIPIHSNSQNKDIASLNQSLWESNVQFMTEYFLKSNTDRYKYSKNNKIILGSEKCADKVKEILTKEGLSLVI